MIRQLGELIDEFRGRECQTRCFTHILNLIAKSIIRQFDVLKGQANTNFDEATTALMELAGNIDVEERDMAESGDDRDDDEEEENTEDWVDERDTMTVEQLAMLNESVQPVTLMLLKVRKFHGNFSLHGNNFINTLLSVTQLRKTTFAIKNSSTIILPRWYEVLDELGLDARMMPRDVSTRWNSTYDMLRFAVDYRVAIDTITAERTMKLCDFELGKEEWKVAKELCEVLKVC